MNSVHNQPADETRRADQRSTLIPHSMPSLGAEDAASVHAVLDGTRLVDGPLKTRFETMLANDTGMSGAVAVTSGSAALHLALQVLDLPPGSRVAIPSYGCLSLLQAVRRAGAEPLLIDCEPGGF
jgi:perosamine synthetase